MKLTDLEGKSNGQDQGSLVVRLVARDGVQVGADALSITHEKDVIHTQHITEGGQRQLDILVEMTRKRKSVLSHLGKARTFVENVLKFGTAVSEVHQFNSILSN